ncbi:MAG: SpoIIE family protein phosphatase, partial [Chloroflexi bacterium]|nr:SpoIIE family protein phosphatase [Chloroflexota bacterium]
MRILIADDDGDLRRLLQVLLIGWGYEVELAVDGAEALGILEAPRSPKLAVLDWEMPRVDGAEICRRLRLREHSSYVYTILLTARDTKQEIVEGINAGADDYLTKPFDAMELHARIRAGERILALESALLDSMAEIKRTDEALAEARRREVEIGVRIQQTLLVGQRPPSTSSVTVATLSAPSLDIDGDFTDFMTYSDDCFDLLIGDVMGKGVPAALMGAAVKNHFVRALCERLSDDTAEALPGPEELVAAVHRAVTAQFIGLERFITLCYARFDLTLGKVSLIDCGHTGTIHRERTAGHVEVCHGENMPLGFSMDEVYRERSIPIQPGDLFVFYSDGITDAMSPAGEVFGVERLAELVSCAQDLDARAVLE